MFPDSKLEEKVKISISVILFLASRVTSPPFPPLAVFEREKEAKTGDGEPSPVILPFLAERTISPPSPALP